MNTGAKIGKLLDGKGWSRAELARRSGLPQGTLTSVFQGTMPGVANGLAIARALCVPVGWLFDDAQEWPPPDTDAQGPFLSDDRLMREAKTRVEALIQDRHDAAREFHEALSGWSREGIEDTPPKPVQEAAERLCSLHGLLNLWRFNVASTVTNVGEPVCLLNAAAVCLPERYGAPPFEVGREGGMEWPLPEGQERVQPISRELMEWHVANAIEHGP